LIASQKDPSTARPNARKKLGTTRCQLHGKPRNGQLASRHRSAKTLVAMAAPFQSSPRNSSGCTLAPTVSKGAEIQRRDTSIGRKITPTPSEMICDATTVMAWSPKICPAMPCTNTIGTNTDTVVSVEAVMAAATSPVPRMVAVRKSSPFVRRRAIDSRTTIELSSNIPTPSASPPSDMMFIDTSPRNIGANVTTTDTGIVTR
jgi:hypothetical protein